MILSTDRIKQVVLGQSPKFIRDAQAYSKRMRMHVNGTNIDAHIAKIDSFERDVVKELRVKYTRSNKDLFARLSRPLDRVFSAKGGTVYYNLPEAQESRAVRLSNEVRNGVSIKKWLETMWLPHLNDDPNGIVFLEILPQQEAILAAQRGLSVVYPTYKPVGKIHNYKVEGNRIEWVVFKLDSDEIEAEGLKEYKADNVYRVVDDSKDYLVAVTSNQANIITASTLDNLFGRVPAVINSDIVDPENESLRLSFFDKAVELADHFFLKGSIKITHDFLHGFPKYAEFADTCNDCAGTGYIEQDKCPSCKGSGLRYISKVSDVKLLNFPDKDQHLVRPNEAGGYISPDKTFHEIATNDLLDLENAMSITIWGVESKLKKVGVGSAAAPGEKTATQVVSEIMPEANRLHAVSEMAEYRHKFILDAVIALNIDNNYRGSSVSYGRRYMLESTDAIWKKYQEARKEGAPQNVLDDMLNEYYDAKFMTDPMALTISKKLMYVEPFVHYTAEKLKALQPAEADYKAKLYFGDWLSTQNEAMLLVQSVDVLKQNLYSYSNAKQLPAPEPAAVV